MPDVTHYDPATDLGPLLEAVQRAALFPDSKTFVDARPLSPPAKILDAWEAARSATDFDLAAFVAAHFAMPTDLSEDDLPQADPEAVSMAEHLRRHWRVLARKPDPVRPHDTLVPLPAPYVVPGGRFREVYYWDTYFTMRGLAVSGRMDLVRHLVANAAHLIATVGHVPNGNRTYYLSRSQPPYFAAMLSLLAERDGLDAALPYLAALKTEYAFWMDGADGLGLGDAHRRVVRVPMLDTGGALLNRYWDDSPTPRPESYREDVEIAEHTPGAERPAIYRHIRAAAESGWDFSSRWMDDPADLATTRATDLVPVDLNAVLYHTEQMLARLSRAAGETHAAERFEAAAEARRTALRSLAWDPVAAYFFDLDAAEGFARRTDRPTLAPAALLYFGLADAVQAAAVAEAWARDFLCPGGLVTTPAHSRGARSREQWDTPNGWAPLHWQAVVGLQRYGHTALANEVRRRWLALNEDVFERTGKMMEKYDVVDLSQEAGGGEYPLQDGFGWTNGVALALLALDG